jgi:hypothetical protein
LRPSSVSLPLRGPLCPWRFPSTRRRIHKARCCRSRCRSSVLCWTIFKLPYPVSHQTTCIRPHSAIYPRGKLRRRVTVCGWQAPTQALLSTSSFCLCCFLLYEALRFRARTRRSMKGTTAQTGAAEHCWATRSSWAKYTAPITALGSPVPVCTLLDYFQTRCPSSQHD